MSDQPENSELEPAPEEIQKEPEVPEQPTGMLPEEEPAPPEMNEISDLRQKLMNEEPDSEPRKALLHRMTGTLSSRKPQDRSKDKSPVGSTFGVRTAGLDDSVDAEVQQEAGVEDQRKGINPRKRASEALAWRKNRLNVDENHLEGVEGQLSEDEAQSSGNPPSKVAPPLQTDAGDPMATDSQSLLLGVYNQEAENTSSETKPSLDSAPVSGESKSSSQHRKQQLNRYIGYNPKRSLWTRYRELSTFDKFLYFTLFIAVVGLLSLLGFLYVGRLFGGQVAATIPTPNLPTATSASAVVLSPNPAFLHLPGGWTLSLTTGSMVEGKWQPKSAEWLQGTELRRVIAIPWNRQVEAVVRTFAQKDKIELEMSNSDNLTYFVESVSQVSAQDSSILYDTTPSLVIILTGSNEETRWVVVARP